ncbi:MAG: hypothetical protein JWM08_1827 [Candidatus Angelobacter sp.]|nr:hypothetical protein [Candidatus Angelobacter sp.]
MTFDRRSEEKTLGIKTVISPELQNSSSFNLDVYDATRNPSANRRKDAESRKRLKRHNHKVLFGPDCLTLQSICFFTPCARERENIKDVKLAFERYTAGITRKSFHERQQ